MAEDKAAVMAAMMDDLGNHRLEELAGHNDGPKSHQRPLTLTNPRNTTRSMEPRVLATQRGSEVAKMYHEAITNGEFDDDDAAAVSGLDPLENGNAHRNGNGHAYRSERPAHPFEPLRGPRNGFPTHPLGPPRGPRNGNGNTYHNGRPKYPFGPSRGSRNTTAPAPKPTYDPRRPAYYRGKKSNMVAAKEDPKVSSLRGNIPYGGQAKRWDGRDPKAAADRKENRPETLAPRSMPSRPQGYPLTAGSDRDKTTQPQQPTITGQLRVNSVNANLGLPPPPTGIPRANPVRAEPKLSPPPTVIPWALETDAPSGDMTSWVPPHLRTMTESLPTTPRSPSVSEHGSSLWSEETNVSAHLGQDNSLRDSSHIPTPDPRPVFLRAKVLVSEANDGESEPVKGQLVLYEAGVWELRVEDKKMFRGDARHLWSVLTDGSMAYLRRSDGTRRVRSTPIRFSNVKKAEKFKKAANEWMPQSKFWHDSAEPFAEEVMDLSSIQDAAALQTSSEPTGQGLNTRESESSRPEQSDSGETRSSTLPVLSPAVNVPATPTEATTGNPEGLASDGSKDVLISSGPNSVGDLIDLNAEELIGTQGKTITDAAVTAMKALRGMHTIDKGPVVDGQSSEWQRVLARASADRVALIRRSELLAIALEHHSTPPDPAFQVSLLHLMETDGFLSLPHDEREKCLAALYTTVRRGDTRIIYSTEELLALRSGRTACPNQIAELNTLIEDGKRTST